MENCVKYYEINSINQGEILYFDRINPETLEAIKKMIPDNAFSSNNFGTLDLFDNGYYALVVNYKMMVDGKLYDGYVTEPKKHESIQAWRKYHSEYWS